jgi:glycosyltransferase involved in cell wall biosynthesis
MKILIYVSSLTAGGAEKVATLMANYWAEQHHVILLTDTPIEEDFFTIDSHVNRQSTNFSSLRNNFITKIFFHIRGLIQLRQIIQKNKPDVIISHMNISNVRILLSSIGLKIPVIIEDHNNPSKIAKMPQPWRLLQPFTYKWLSTVIVLLTPELIKFYPSTLVPKIRIIPNPLNIPINIPESNEVTLHKPTFIAVGSLTEQKGLDYLLDAYSKVSNIKPEWHLTILGEGHLRNALIKQAAELGISEKVHMPGRIKNPYSVLKNADIYVMSSRFEGFPVALCEAMGVGLPCISFDCPTGPADIIVNNINGILVEYLNVDLLAQSMIELASDPIKCEKLSSEALKINQTLSLSTIMSQWETIIQSECKVTI